MSNKRITLRKGCVIRYADTPESLAKLKKMGYKEVDSKPVKVDTDKEPEEDKKTEADKEPEADKKPEADKEPEADKKPETDEEPEADEKPKGNRRNSGK